MSKAAATTDDARYAHRQKIDFILPTLQLIYQEGKCVRYSHLIAHTRLLTLLRETASEVEVAIPWRNMGLRQAGLGTRSVPLLGK